jgi:hypothetical protein
MKKVKIIAGIAWAIISLVVIVILFPGLNSFSASAAKLPFMKINPNYTGGEVAKEIVSEGCTLRIRKPVFDGLIRERKHGFVQVDWKGTVPEKINDTIDFNFDGIPDFSVLIDRKIPETKLYPLNTVVVKLGTSTQTSYGWAVRVELKNTGMKDI